MAEENSGSAPPPTSEQPAAEGAAPATVAPPSAPNSAAPSTAPPANEAPKEVSPPKSASGSAAPVQSASARDGKSARSATSAAGGAQAQKTPKASAKQSPAGSAKQSPERAGTGQSRKPSRSPSGRTDRKKSAGSSARGARSRRSDFSGASSVVHTERQNTINIDELPDGCVPLFLSGITQKLFSLKVNEDITRESPIVLVKKEMIISDMKTRAAVSDFSEVKQTILNYPGEELLLIYDYEFKRGQNFIIATTEECKELILHPPQKEAPPTEEPVIEYKYVPPVSKPWLSYGSEQDVDTARVTSTRPLISMTVKRPLKELTARELALADRAPGAKESYAECRPSEEKPFDVRVMELSDGVQAVPGAVTAGTQTTWRYPENKWMQTQFREMGAEESAEAMGAEPLAKFAAASEASFDVSLQQNEIANMFLDDWELLAEDDEILAGHSDTHLREYQSFTELDYSKERLVSHIEWHPTIRGVLACSVAQRRTFDERVEHSARIVLEAPMIVVWSFSDPIHPQLLLRAPDDVLAFQFCASNPAVVAAGCVNGQLVLWDTSEYTERLRAARPPPKKKTTLATLPGFDEEGVNETPVLRYCAVSSIEHGHRSAITDLLWLPDHFEVNRMGVPIENRALHCYQLMTAAADNTVLFWDIRPQKGERLVAKDTPLPMGVPATFRHLDLVWRPFLKVHLFKSEPGGDHNPTCFSIQEHQGDRSILSLAEDSKEADNSMTLGGQFVAGTGRQAAKERHLTRLVTHFYVGTEDGEVVYVDWMPQKDQDTGKIQTSKPVCYHSLHDGPIVSMTRSPFFKDMLLCVGGWNFSVWKESENSGPIVHSATHTRRLSCGCWSPSRPGVFFIGGVDGTIDVWDLTERTHEPSFSQHVSPAPLITMSPLLVSKKQQLLAIGDYEGTLHVLEVPSGLRQPAAGEQQQMTAFVVAEGKRRQFEVKRWNLREQEKIEVEIENKRKAGIAPAAVLSEEELEAKMLAEYNQYLVEESNFLRQGGFTREEADEIIAKHRATTGQAPPQPKPEKSRAAEDEEQD